MTSWIDRAYQRVSSLNMGPVSLGRRQSARSVPNEVTNFKQMVGDLKKDDSPDHCIAFFMTHFGGKSDRELSEYGISGELGRLIRHLSHFFDLYTADQLLIERAISFLIIAVQHYQSTSRTETALFRIIIKISQTNDNNIIEAASSFVQMCLNKPDLLEFLFSGTQLSSLWTNIFIENDIACLYLGTILNAAASNFQVKELNNISSFLEKVMNDLNEGKIDQNNASISLLFLSYIVKTINTGDFLPSIFPIICDLAPFCENLTFFEPLLVAPTSDQPAVWAALDAICYNPELNIELLQSSLIAIHNCGIPADPEVFSFNSFISRMVELDNSYQSMLFDVLKNSKKETRADFLCWVMPLSQTGVSTKDLLEIVDYDFGPLLDNIILKFLIEPELDEVQLCLVSDTNFFQITEILINQISRESENIPLLFEKFSNLMIDGDSSNYIIAPLLVALMMKANTHLYIDNLVGLIRSGLANDELIKTFSEISLKIHDFNDLFLFTMKGYELIDLIVETEAGLDFLACLVTDGPFQEVDDFIFEHFHETSLSKYEEKFLINLMMGLPHDSQKSGFLRIPSLCAFVKNPPLRTPYDQYIYGSIATKYFTPTNEQIMKFAVRYMTNEQALAFCKDPEILPSITDPLFPHYIVYQMHPCARNCSVNYQRNACCSFWFMVNELYGKTTLAEFPGGTLDLESNGYVTFSNRSVYCPLKEWHLFSFVTTEKQNSQQKIISGYFDGKKIGELNTSGISTLKLGTDDQLLCNALWFISPFLHSSSIPLEQEEIKKMYESGPHAISQKTMNASKGVKLVPYQGILRYMHLFGGPYFIFNLLLEVQTKEHFMFYMQSAFNLFKMGLYERSKFYSSLHYIMRRKLKLFSPQVEQMFHLELESVQNEDNFDWPGLINLVGDVVLLSSSYISYQFYQQIFQVHKVCENAIPFFHILLDSFVFFDVVSEESILSKNNILDIFKLYLKYQPVLIKKVLMAILAIPHCDSDEVFYDLKDERFRDKQKLLLDFIKSDIHLYTSQISCSDSFLFAVKLDNELFINFFEFIADICISYPDYFDGSYFRKIVPHLFYFVRNEKFWMIIFSFLMNKKASSLEEYLMFNTNRNFILPIIFDLLTHLIPFEIKQNSSNSISFRVMHTLYSLIMTQSLSLVDYTSSIQNLCSLGFGEKNNIPYPFQFSKKQQPSPRRQSRTRTFRPSFESSGDNQPDYGIHNLVDMDPDIYDLLNSYLKCHPISLDQFADLEFPETELPDDISSFFDSNIVEFIVLVAAKSLAGLGHDSSAFKKALSPLTIYGADVPPSIAISMHRKVIFALLEEHLSINNDSFIILVEFLTHRVIEGWWDNTEFKHETNKYEKTGDDNEEKIIVKLFEKVLSISENYYRLQHKVFHNFIIGCISKIDEKNTELIKEMVLHFLSLPTLTSFCISNRTFANSLIYLITTHEMLTLANKSDENTFYKNLSQVYSRDYPEFSHPLNSNSGERLESIKQMRVNNSEINTTYLSHMRSIENSATANSAVVAADRLDVTRKSRSNRVIRFERKNIAHVTTVRRSFRFEMFIRMNSELVKVEHSIVKIFQASIQQERSQKLPEKYTTTTSTHPLAVPIRQVPLLFPYEANFEKVAKLPTAPVAEFQNNEINTSLSEFKTPHYGPKCLQGWDLPGHYRSQKAGIAQLFLSIYKNDESNHNNNFEYKYNFNSSSNSTIHNSSMMSSSNSTNIHSNNSNINKEHSFHSSGSISNFTKNRHNDCLNNELFKCKMLASPEPLHCVGLLTSERLIILMNATLKDYECSDSNNNNEKEIVLYNERCQLYHYPLFEGAIQGLYGPSSLFFGHVVLYIPFSLATIALQRTYIYSKNAIDIFTAYGCHFSLVVERSHSRKQILNKMKTMKNSTTRRGPGFSARLLGKSVEQISKFWTNNLLSNFDYLLYLNTVAGRSFNDFSQYPIFPWVVGDYDTYLPQKLRDLSKPMGQLSPERAQRYDEVYRESDPHYYYGSHYSYPAAVLYFLMRSEPHTLYNMCLHNGFDHPDRVFRSIQESWKSSSELNSADVKELIPEFYCCTSMFENNNHYTFPKRTDGVTIDNVELPPHITPLMFVYQMRNILESREVSDFLPKWIDLIFGYKQRGEEALKAKNLFHPLSYDNAIRNSESKEAENAVITNFGQCPSQLFTSPHPQRLPKDFITLLNSDEVRTTELRKIPMRENDKVASIYVIDEEVRALPKFSHYIGIPPKSVSITEGIFNINGQCQYIEPLFDITATATSSDGMILTVASGCGMIVNFYYSDKFSQISRSLLPGESFQTVAVSLHFALVAAASRNMLFLFDLTSGFLIRKKESENIITEILFDEVNDYIITCDSKKISLIELDFKIIAEHFIHDENEKVTALSVCDSVIWFPKPFFVTGHISGQINLWEVNIFEQSITKIPLSNPFSPGCFNNSIYNQNNYEENHFKSNHENDEFENEYENKEKKNKIVAISVFNGNRSLVCANEEGRAFVISSNCILRRVLKQNCFELCPTCHNKLVSHQTMFCSVCGIPSCKQCFSPSKAPLCKLCEYTNKHNKANIHKSGQLNPQVQMTGSLSMYRTEDNLSSFDILPIDQPCSLDSINIK
ncbi:hypothetical protein TRFO_14189 [Tritrichomonas foetus]|uniref:BEACH domain-containing protein n=1 Tax=Tritrichomonas foetus TaxID=1144522 RepID=A0A1J4KWN8_9EUKA|nr:hypothetical protein TRFO_14189 [Tritrichomonas foetus]|eukprot:OHT15288.1 hypothetical protein TRFO_14189 [Tritrichomonas foetus]